MSEGAARPSAYLTSDEAAQTFNGGTLDPDHAGGCLPEAQNPGSNVDLQSAVFIFGGDGYLMRR